MATRMKIAGPGRRRCCCPRAGAHAAPEGRAQEEVGDQGDHADQDADQRGEADVVVAHVRHLVGDDALELLAVQPSSSPRVTATEACCGSRPVAKALGAGSSMT